MKKIIIVDDDEDVFEHIVKLCNELSIPCFPSSKGEFSTFRSNFTAALWTAIHHDRRISAQEDIQKSLNDFIGDDFTNTAVILDFHLNEDEPEITGFQFYSIFLRGLPAVVASGTELIRELRIINEFCEENSAPFIRKNYGDLNRFVRELKESLKKIECS